MISLTVSVSLSQRKPKHTTHPHTHIYAHTHKHTESRGLWRLCIALCSSTPFSSYAQGETMKKEDTQRKGPFPLNAGSMYQTEIFHY